MFTVWASDESQQTSVHMSSESQRTGARFNLELYSHPHNRLLFLLHGSRYRSREFTTLVLTQPHLKVITSLHNSVCRVGALLILVFTTKAVV